VQRAAPAALAVARAVVRFFVARNSTLENANKNPIHWQKNFEFVREFEVSSELRSL